MKDSGEVLTCPSHRVPSLRDPHLSKLVGATLKARSETCELNDNDVYVLFDGGKHGNETSLTKVFTNDDGALTKSKRIIYVAYNEESVCERYHKKTGTAVQQEEMMLLMTKTAMAPNGRRTPCAHVCNNSERKQSKRKQNHDKHHCKDFV